MKPLPTHIQSLRPYLPGQPVEDLARRLGLPVQSIVKLASNENPLGTSPRAKAAMAASEFDPSRYPDNDCFTLTAALSDHHGLAPQNIVVGCGSEGLLSMAATALLAGDRSTVYPQYAFQAFVNSAQRCGAQSIVVPATPSFHADLDRMLEAIRPDTSLVYLPNPGNPTGTRASDTAVEAFLRAVPADVVLLLDEAYREYAPTTGDDPARGWVERHPNLLITRTFSKAYGLAGLRVGYGVAQASLIQVLQRVRPPFTVTELAQRAAVAALGDHEFLAETARVNREGLAQLQQGFDALQLRYVPSEANFVLVEVGDGKAVAGQLEQHGLIVRPVANYGLPTWLRISVGLPEQNERLLRALGTIVQR